MMAGTGATSVSWTVDEDTLLSAVLFSKAALLTYDASASVTDFSGPTVTRNVTTAIAAAAINGQMVSPLSVILEKAQKVFLNSASGGVSALLFLS